MVKKTIFHRNKNLYHSLDDNFELYKKYVLYYMFNVHTFDNDEDRLTTFFIFEANIIHIRCDP